MNVVLRVHGLHACDKLRKSHASVRKYLLQRAVECGYSIYRLERLFGGGLAASSACGAVGIAAVIDVLACLLMLSIHLASFRVSAPSLINEEHCVVVHDCPAKGLKVETEHWPSTPQPASLLPPGGSKETPPCKI